MSLGTAIDLLTWAVITANIVAVLLYRRVRYRAGWLDGRIDLLEHMARAHQEGLPFDAFMRQVAARDGFLIPEDPEAHR